MGLLVVRLYVNDDTMRDVKMAQRKALWLNVHKEIAIGKKLSKIP